MALDAAANLASGQWELGTYMAAAWCQLGDRGIAYAGVSLDLVREHDGDVELLRELLQARQELVQFLTLAKPSG